jgi:hypothetical protein
VDAAVKTIFYAFAKLGLVSFFVFPYRVIRQGVKDHHPKQNKQILRERLEGVT